MYFQEQDLLTIWVSNRGAEFSKHVAPSVACSLVGRPYNGATLGIGGGTGGSYGGVFGGIRHDGHWPVGTYKIPEIEQQLVLSQDGDGRLLASTAGFEPTLVSLQKGVRKEATFEGTIQRTHDRVTIQFRLDGSGLPEPVSVSMQTKGRKTMVLNGLVVSK